MELEILKRDPSVASSLAMTKAPFGTIILVHGAWHSAVCWSDNFLPYFAEQGYRVLAPSLRNHGKSASNGALRWQRIRDYVADIQQVIEQNSEGKIYLIGHSMGGHVIQKYLELNPKSPIEKAVLLSSVPPHGVWRATLKSIFKHPMSFLLVNLTWSLKPLIKSKERIKELFFTDKISEKQLENAFQNVEDESYLAYLDMLFLDLPKPKKINIPILVIGGTADYIFNKKDVLATAKAFYTEGSLFEGEAHNLFMENSWRDAAKVILDFLAYPQITQINTD
jgi:pimeloyl-ACP methyl ester carboxylesterase